MKQTPWRLIAAGAITMGAISGTAATAQDSSVFTLKDDVPPEALAVAQAAAPGVEFDMVSIEIEDGKVTLELSGTDQAGNVVEVDVATDSGWSVQEVESEISPEEVPASVNAALAEHLPGFKAERIERSERPNGVTVYEFEGTDREGRFLVVEISGDGSEVNYDRSDLS